MNVVKNIICELTGYRPGTVDVSQGDRGSRTVSCRLMENGAPWMIPEGATARVAYTLPDGTEGLYDRRPDGSPMWEISGNIVTVELADQLMTQAGMVQMSILILGPEGGQLATWPIRVMVVADSPARLTVPEAMPPYGAGFAGKIFFGGEDGTVTPLGIGEGVEIVRQEDGTFVLVAYGGSGGAGGIVEEKDPTVYEWAKQPQKPTYTAQEVGAMPAETKIPGKTSDLTNDAGFVTKAVSDLANYYTKVQTQELIAAIPRFRVTVVQQPPAAGEELVLYLVPFATAEGQYLEYLWADGRWEVIGSQRVDLTGYATEVWVKDYVAEHSGRNLNLTVETITVGEDSGGDDDSPVAVTGLSLDLTSYSAKVGGGFYINPIVAPANATNRSVTWKSDKPAVATVNAMGYVECIAAGDAVITCTTVDGGFTATCAVSVASAGSGGGTGGDKERFSTLEKTSGFFKADGTVASLGSTYHVCFPYTEGMQISTGTNGSWNVSTYPPIVVLDDGEYSTPTCTKAESTISVGGKIVTQYTATLTGYSENAIVYASLLSGTKNGSVEAAMDDADIYYYIPGGEN